VSFPVVVNGSGAPVAVVEFWGWNVQLTLARFVGEMGHSCSRATGTRGQLAAAERGGPAAVRRISIARVVQRVLIYGVTGSGKTTLAARLAEQTGLPFHCVDDLTWNPGWVPVPADEQRRRIAAICAQDSWILDHGYRSWLDVPLARADLIVGLDYPRWRSLSRLIWRTLSRAIDHREICNGNTESLRQVFSKNSIIIWHFRSFAKNRRRIRAWQEDPAKPAVVRLTSPAATRRWLTDAVGSHRLVAPT
jgi:adenylate kinase family enzyme